MSYGWIRCLRWLFAVWAGGLVWAQTPSRSGVLDINAFQRALPAPGDTTPAAPKIQHPQALAWDTQTREIHAKDGQQSVDFRFALTNVWTNAVTISGTRTSCGCTVARLPETPWVIAPGQRGEISGNMNLLGKSGTVVKTVTVSTDVGSIMLNVKVHIAPPDAGRMRDADRQRNLAVAAADRQAVFRGECASCHVTPTVGKKGAELYATACGICHDAENKATMVPALRDLKHPTDRAFWMQWIRNGKANSLMPAFDLKQGGILDEEQMASLADHLDSAAFKTASSSSSSTTPAKSTRP